MAEPERPGLGEGAGEAAPTAPHATPPSAARRSSPVNGPERFWRRGRRRLALTACLVLSAAAHFTVAPLELPHGFEVNDVEGEAAIPVDLLAPDEAPPLIEAPPPPLDDRGESEKSKPLPGPNARLDAGPALDAAALRDAAIEDGAADASKDGGADASRDGVADASDGSTPDIDGAVAHGDLGGDGGATGNPSGPRSPEDVVGAAGAIQADVVLVMLIVNADAIRQHPVGQKIGFLLRGIPQWDEFMSGTDINPVRDADWVMVFGPSLINTARDVVLVHYSVSDAVVDHAVDVVSHKYSRGGPVDAGVPGVKASLAHADRAERILVRPRPHVLAVVPPDVLQKVARQLATRTPAFTRPKDEAVYLRLVNPHHPIPEIPESLSEMRLRVVARADKGVDVYIDGDTKDPAAAADAADALRRVVRRHNDTFTSMLTHGILDGVTVTSEGNEAKVHAVVSLDQIETVAALVGSFLGIQVDSLPSSPAAAPNPAGAPGRPRPN